MEPIALCFVDFDSSSYAATAMMALQGYKVDEQNPKSTFLEIKFARHPAQVYESGSASQRFCTNSLKG